MVLRLAMMEKTEPSLGITVRGKEGGEGPEKTPVSRMLMLRPMRRE